MFDIYLDFRQRSKYTIQKLPQSFEIGFKLSDSIDKKYIQGQYERKDIELSDSMKINNSGLKPKQVATSDSEISKPFVTSSPTNSDAKLMMEKILGDFKNG